MPTIRCNECKGESGYFNGSNYECPECGCEWSMNDGTTLVSGNTRKQSMNLDPAVLATMYPQLAF